MTVNFPLTPNVDDIVTSLDGQEWRWDGVKWVAVGSAGGGGASVTINDDPPDDPGEGDLWWNHFHLSLWDGTQWVATTDDGEYS